MRYIKPWNYISRRDTLTIALAKCDALESQCLDVFASSRVKNLLLL
jgi:hypothetical protein